MVPWPPLGVSHRNFTERHLHSVGYVDGLRRERSLAERSALAGRGSGYHLFLLYLYIFLLFFPISWLSNNDFFCLERKQFSLLVFVLVLHYALEVARQINAVVYGNAIAACSQRWDVARCLLEEMHLKAVETNTVIFNSVAKSYAEKSLWQEAEELLENMKEEHFPLDSISYASLMHASMANAWQRALLVLSELPGSAFTCVSPHSIHDSHQPQTHVGKAII